MSKAYRKPPAGPVLEGQQPLFGAEQGIDPKAEAERKRLFRRQLVGWYSEAKRTMEAIKVVWRLNQRGIQQPDIAQALGLPPVVERASKPLNPWRIRPGSNIEIVADMLETAARRGVSEDEMVERLQSLGRLSNARDPKRAVHWTITELQRRTRFCFRESSAMGARWYAYGTFAVWRQAPKTKENPNESA